MDRAAGIGATTDVAVVGEDRAGHGGVRDGTAVARMQSHGVVSLIVDAFDDIDLARIRPVGTNHPESWPRSTRTARHVRKIEDHESGIVHSIAGQSDALAPGSGCLLAVCAELHAARGVADQPSLLGSTLVNVLNEAFCWIGSSEELEFAEELAS